MPSAVADCPKRMVFGPCGGVRDDNSCELDDRRCPFVDLAAVAWPDDAVRASQASPLPLLTTAARRPVVVTDLTVAPYDVTSLRDTVALIAPSCDGLLVGEHQNRPDFPPTLMAAEIMAAGGQPWITLTCRDRNRIVLEQELSGLAALDVPGVLCATGDVRGQGVRRDVTQVFDLDGTRLAALAAEIGLRVAVPESPEAAPRSLRPKRIAGKQRAGASLCILNHARDSESVASFVRAARAAGATLPFIASVALYTDERSAAVLQAFPGLHLDGDTVRDVLSDTDSVRRGIEIAVQEANRLLAIDGVIGVNISGLASSQGLVAAAEIKAEVGRRLLGTATA